MKGGAINPVFAVELPETGALRPTLARASFPDFYASPLADDALAPVEIFLRARRATPAWVDSLMALRNAVVRRRGDVNQTAGYYCLRLRKSTL